jgi:hypothetical protein
MRMTTFAWLGLAASGVLFTTSDSTANPPSVAPIHTVSLPGFPGDNGHDGVAYCGSDIIYVRFSDRAIRILRQGGDGSWLDTPFPQQGSPSGTDYTRVYGHGNLLAVVYFRLNANRAELYERNSDGVWSRVQVIASPIGSSFVNLHHAVWSGSTLLLVDRYADSYRGAAFVFQRNAQGQWVQEAKLQGSGANPFYTEVWSAGLDGNRAVLGHWLNTCGYGAVSGRAYVFERSATGSWAEQVNFRPPTAVCSDAFAANVSIAGDMMYASAPGAGRIYRLRKQSGAWSMATDVPLPPISGTVQGTRLLATDWGLISRTSDARLVVMQNAGQSMLAAAILTPNALQSADCYCWNIALSGSRVATITGSGTGSQLSVFDLGNRVDCDGDGVSNADEIITGASDANSDGIPDTCICPGDVIQNGVVDGADLSALLSVWGTAGGIYPRADANGDGVVNGSDLSIVLSGWGACAQ